MADMHKLSIEQKVAELERQRQILIRRAQDTSLPIKERNELMRKANIAEDQISRYRYPA